MKAVFRTPLTPEEIRFILSSAAPERMDCGLLRYAAYERPAGDHRGPPQVSRRSDDSGWSSG